ncbi:DEP domain-containing mTOR-interacting protein isoform X1 [Bos mutus]|uniref:DEP domain-containing mTOR-interacting protein isoform X1 n=1 Tax=Bos mutus TaxID=72004 RepID=UPI0038B64FB7
MFPSWPRPRPRGAQPRPHVGGLSGHRPPPSRGSQWRVSSAPPPAKMAGAVSVRAGWGSEPSPRRTTETEGAARAMEGGGGGDGGARQRELERMAEVLVTGEQLRLRLHEEKVIKDRRHHLKTYPNCFVAKELIDWLIEHKEASDRETAIKLMQKLADRGIIHHVCDEHKEFKDVKLFYRFRKDDGTFPLDNEVKAFVRGQRLYEKLMSPENTLLQPREEEGVKYERTFMASEFLDWLVQEGEATAREEAEQLCQRLLEHGIIQHVSNKHPFVDSNLLYQFRMNFRRRRRLMELLSEKSPSSQETHDSPFCLRKQGHDNRKSASFTSVSPSKEIKTASAARRSSMGSCGSGGYFSSSPTLSNSPPVLCNPKSVLKRPVTSEELLTPGAPYARKTFTIVGDAVGWGFVVRGSKPCHIQAVDPSGPAAAAGMKGYSGHRPTIKGMKANLQNSRLLGEVSQRQQRRLSNVHCVPTFYARDCFISSLHVVPDKSFILGSTVLSVCELDAKTSGQTSLVIQSSRIRLPVRETQVWSLVWEDPTCLGAAKSEHHGY